MKLLDISEQTKKEYAKKLYDCFQDGRAFEIFLNHFLTKIGFEEVITTKYVGDKGIDLTCIKKGVDLGGIDTINYYVQAKRYNPANKVQAKEVRDLKGTKKYDKNGRLLSGNYVNILITTSDFTKGALEEVEDDINNRTILINGIQLVEMCIDNEIGFVFQPVFQRSEIADILLSNGDNRNSSTSIDGDNENYLVMRNITANDIRARILILPQIIKNSIPKECKAIDVTINETDYKLKIDKTRTYLGDVTEIYKKCGLISDDNAYVFKQAKWKIVADKYFVTIE